LPIDDENHAVAQSKQLHLHCSTASMTFNTIAHAKPIKIKVPYAEIATASAGVKYKPRVIPMMICPHLRQRGSHTSGRPTLPHNNAASNGPSNHGNGMCK